MARLQTRYRDIYVVIYTGNPTTINAMADGYIATETMPYHPIRHSSLVVGRRMNSVITKVIKKRICWTVCRALYTVPPGEYLQEWLEENEVTQQQAANLLGYSRRQVNEIVNGLTPVTPDTATRLQRVTGITADSWLTFEAAYRKRDHPLLQPHDPCEWTKEL